MMPGVRPQGSLDKNLFPGMPTELQAETLTAVGNMNPAGIQFTNPMTGFGLGNPFLHSQNYGLPQVPGLVPPFNPMPR